MKIALYELNQLIKSYEIINRRINLNRSMSKQFPVHLTRSRVATFGNPRELEIPVPKQNVYKKPSNTHFEIQEALLKEPIKKEHSSFSFCLFMAYALFLLISIIICCLILTSGTFGSLVEIFLRDFEAINMLQNTRISCYYLLTSVLECLVLAIVGMIWALIVLILTLKGRSFFCFMVVQSIILIATEISGFLSVQGSCPSVAVKTMQQANPNFTLPQPATFYLGLLFVLNLVSLITYGCWIYGKIKHKEQTKKTTTS